MEVEEVEEAEEVKDVEDAEVEGPSAESRFAR